MDQENEQRRRLVLAALEKPNEDVVKRNKINQKKQQVCNSFVAGGGGTPGLNRLLLYGTSASTVSQNLPTVFSSPLSRLDLIAA